jgi:hypothetical protein
MSCHQTLLVLVDQDVQRKCGKSKIAWRRIPIAYDAPLGTWSGNVDAQGFQHLLNKKCDPSPIRLGGEVPHTTIRGVPPVNPRRDSAAQARYSERKTILPIVDLKEIHISSGAPLLDSIIPEVKNLVLYSTMQPFQ